MQEIPNQTTNLLFPPSMALMPRGWRGVFLQVLLGASAALALPPTGWWPLLLCLGFSFSLARNFNLKCAMVAGLAAGLGYFAVALHWIGYAFLVDAARDLWMMPFAVGGLAAIMAVYWALAYGVARVVMRWGAPWFAAFPVVMAGAEYLRGVLFTGFPWAAPGLVADGMGGVLQAASVFGMQGLTFWLLLWSSLAVALVARHVKTSSGLVSVILLLLLLPGFWVWGLMRVASSPEAAVPGVRLLLVQPNVPQNDKWQSENAGAIFEQLMRMSRVAGEQPSHIIWPESAVPFLLDESAGGKAAIATQLTNGQVLMAGAVRRQVNADNAYDYYTSILMYDDAGRLLDAYDKWRLVPGGEYLPFEWLLEPLGFRQVVDVPESFSAGTGPRSIAVPSAGLAAMLICYEAIFPQQLVDRAVRPAWLVNVTNDGWFGLSTGPYQHLAQARMRAVEQDLPLARAANSGISAIIDGKGRFIARSRLGTEATVTGVLPVAGPPTPFASFGILAAFLSAVVVLASLTYWCNTSLNTQSD